MPDASSQRRGDIALAPSSAASPPHLNTTTIST
jgi:hypothetical protein